MDLTAGLSGHKKWKRQEVGGVEEFWRAKFQKAPEGCPASLWSPHPFVTAPVQLAGLSSFRGAPKRRKSGVNCFGERVLYVAARERPNLIRPSGPAFYSGFVWQHGARPEEENQWRKVLKDDGKRRKAVAFKELSREEEGLDYPEGPNKEKRIDAAGETDSDSLQTFLSVRTCNHSSSG